MEKLVVDLYEQMNANQIHNRTDSQYWIYRIESEIKRVNGLSKRFIKVLFFNRYFNENNNLMRLYLNVNGNVVEQETFSVVSQYNNPSVLGFVIEVNLEDEQKNVEIVSYIMDGKKVELSDVEVPYFKVDHDEEKFRLLTTYKNLNRAELFAIPQVHDDFWICTCGNYNQGKANYCAVCATKKDDAEQIASLDYNQLILEGINEKIVLNPNESLEQTVEKYVEAYHTKYGLDKDEIRSRINYPELIKKRNFVESSIIQNDPIHASQPQYNVTQNVETKSSKKWFIVIGILAAIVIAYFLYQSVMEPQRRETCIQNGGLWVEGKCYDSLDDFS